jgi:hypothetical protein
MQEKENAHAGDMGAKNSNGSSKDVPKSKSSINREDLQQQKLNAALYYARRGWPVFPLHYPTKSGCSCKNPQCSSVGKHPLTKNGFKDATTDEKVVRMWWRKWPDANVGIVTGKESGFIALDLDPRHEGDESIRKLEKRYGRMPETIESLTGGGGRHILFSHPGKRIKVMNSAGLGGKYPGLDIRGDGGYIVAPPSNHLSGNKYKWEPSHSPIDVELARIPDFLLKLISDKKRRISTISEVGDIIPEGERNVILTSIAGSMRRRGLTEEEIYAALEKVNINRCRPPLPDEEVRHIAKSIMKYKPGRQPKKLGKSTPEKTAKIISKLPYELSVTDLWREIESILFGKFDDKKEYPMEIRRRDAGNLLLGWLQERGGFTQSTEGELFYFYEKHRRLFNIESEAWQAWLSMITNIIYVSTHFKYLDAYCKATALRTKKRRIYRCSYWDDNEKVLYVSRFDGTVYRLDGESITEGPNGKNVLFNDDVNWEPYKPEPGTKTNTLYWLTTELPNWDGNKEMYGLAFRAFIISTFFLELIPAKPILVMYGEKESGKSTCLRLMLRLLYGSFENVSGVPDKPDGFTAAASSAHILAIDNLDDIVPWMRDKLSRLSTGAIDECRKLFTSNEVLRIRYRCSLCITSRTPDTLRRDDLTDRLLILPVRIIKEGRKAERDLYQEVVERRNEFWYEMLNILSKVVRAIREGKLCSNYSIRMADWESLARLIAQEEGNEDLWDEFIPIYTTSQADFLLEGDPICDAIEQAMDNNWLNNKKFTSRELFETLTKALFGDDKIPKGWYKSPQSFSKRLASIRPVLAQVYGLRWEKGTTKATLNRYVYWFDEENKKDNNV